MPDQQIAVLIDYENVGPSAIQWVLDQVSDIGRVIVKRAYGDWPSTRDQANQLVEMGIEPVQLFRVARGGKNAGDMRLVIDAIELLYQSPVDTFVIMSSDSDFVPLVRKLRSAGKTVIGAGRQATVPRPLVASCDRYFYLDQRTETETEQSRQSSQEARRVESLLVRAVRATMDEQGQALGSRVFQAMQRLDPAFDFHALGFSTFTRYLEAAPEVRVTRSQGAGDTMVELAERPSSNGRRGAVPPPSRRQRKAQPTVKASASGSVPPPAPLSPPAAAAVTAPPAPAQAASSPGAQPSVQREQPWDALVDAAWTRRAAHGDGALPGSTAAAEAAKALGAENLRSTQYRTLARLIQASKALQGRWEADGNRVVRKGIPQRLQEQPQPVMTAVLSREASIADLSALSDDDRPMG
ncbi:MAG: NYN domain-containing protein [Chloroflexi bacterium]|nr:NYN domain-containing protein [Chloroflexota bacterium]